MGSYDSLWSTCFYDFKLIILKQNILRLHLFYIDYGRIYDVYIARESFCNFLPKIIIIIIIIISVSIISSIIIIIIIIAIIIVIIIINWKCL